MFRAEAKVQRTVELSLQRVGMRDGEVLHVLLRQSELVQLQHEEPRPRLQQDWPPRVGVGHQAEVERLPLHCWSVLSHGNIFGGNKRKLLFLSSVESRRSLGDQGNVSVLLLV